MKAHTAMTRVVLQIRSIHLLFTSFIIYSRQSPIFAELLAAKKIACFCIVVSYLQGECQNATLIIIMLHLNYS
jgi:hypothetical protein